VGGYHEIGGAGDAARQRRFSGVLLGGGSDDSQVVNTITRTSHCERFSMIGTGFILRGFNAQEPSCCAALAGRLAEWARGCVQWSSPDGGAGALAFRDRRSSVNVTPPRQGAGKAAVRTGGEGAAAGAAAREGTVLGSIANLCNCMIGVGGRPPRCCTLQPVPIIGGLLQ
jgi:hypothetical protein